MARQRGRSRHEKAARTLADTAAPAGPKLDQFAGESSDQLDRVLDELRARLEALSRDDTTIPARAIAYGRYLGELSPEILEAPDLERTSFAELLGLLDESNPSRAQVRRAALLLASLTARVELESYIQQTGWITPLVSSGAVHKHAEVKRVARYRAKEPALKKAAIAAFDAARESNPGASFTMLSEIVAKRFAFDDQTYSPRHLRRLVKPTSKT